MAKAVHIDAVQAMARRARSLPMLQALAYRDYRYLLGGTFATNMGQWVQQVGKGWLAYELTGSPFQLGLVAFFQGAAMFLVAPIGGTVADRFDRRKVMMVSQFLVAIVALVVAFLVLTDAVQIWHLYVTSFVSGGLFSVNNPTRQALVFSLVGRDHIRNAVALNSISMNTARIIGPAGGGIMLAKIGVEGAYFVQAAGFLIALGTVFMIRGGGGIAEGPGRGGFRQSMIIGLRYARHEPTIGLLLVYAFIAAMLGWPFLYLMPAYAQDVLKTGETGYGVIMGAVGVGAIIASAIIACAGDLPHKGKTLVAALFMMGAFLMLLSVSTNMGLSIAILMGVGLCSATQLATNQTLIQLNVAEQYRGRVMSLYFLGFGLQPLGVLPAGALAERYGVGVGLLVLGGVMALSIAVVTLLGRRVLQL